MAQLERPQRQVDNPKTPTTIHTMEQLLRAGEASKSKLSPTSNSSSPSSPFLQRLRHHDSEEDHGQNQKKSVLTKVKEKAKKLRHSLSKRRHDDWNVSSPSSATSIEGDGVEEDAEYLGAPMYESEKAPVGYKANVRQLSSPRETPITPEKHVISSSDKHVVEQDQGRSLNSSMSKNKTTQPVTTTTSPNAITTAATTTTTAATTTAAAAATTTPTTTNNNNNNNNNNNTFSRPNKPMSETLAQKLAPVNVEAPHVIPSITSKFQGLTVSTPTEHHDQPSSSTVKTTRNTSLSYAAPRTPPAKLPSQASSSTPQAASSTPVTLAPSSAPPLSIKATSPTAQIWDKGVSMREYLMNKLEPGEDDKALSRVISEAMSPRRTPGDAGVMEKVRQAVTSLLRTEEPTKYADTNTSPTSTTPRASSQMPTSTNASSPNASHAASQMPASTNASSPNASHAASQMPASINASSPNASRAASQMTASTNASSPNASRAASQMPGSTNISCASSQMPTSTNVSRASSSQMPASTNASRASSSQMPVATNASRASYQMPASTNITRTSSQIPVSYNAQEDFAVAEEENHGRILQAN